MGFNSICLSQLNDKEKFIEAMYLMDEKRFPEAQEYLLELYKIDPENSNVNYNLGLTYLNSFEESEKKKALPFLIKASNNTSPNYSPFNPREKKAPVDTYFYLAQAQHSDYQFLEAIENYKKFETYINEKHYLWNEVEKNISMATYAQKAILNPVNIEIINLGDQMNGYYPDFSPVTRIDETAIYYTSRRLREDSSNYLVFDPLDGMHYEDIYVSYHNEEEDTWGEPSPLNINTIGHEATVNLSIDGRTLYIYKDINGNGELFESRLKSDSAGIEIWSKPVKLGSDINTKAYETHVAPTPDGRRLYFISDREGGYGGKDIYFCNLLPNGQWALAQNAGPVLNTEFDEDGVFMHPDGETMYFSSNGHESMGGYDILKSIQTDSGWSKPENLGYPINSIDDDVFFVTSPDGKRAYFSSFKEGGYGEKDIYKLNLLDAAESALTLYRGEFTFVDRMEPPAGALVSIINNNTGDEVGTYVPRQRDGQFSAILEVNTSYHFIYEADAYETYEEDIYVPSSSNYSEIYKEIQLKPVRVGDGMNTIESEPTSLAAITGTLAIDGVAMQNIIIKLMNENRALLEQTETDQLGQFKFTKLDPTNTYLMQIESEDLNPMLGFTIDVQNDKGETLTFEKIDDSTFIFVPSLQPYQYYGISARALSGQIKNAGEPAAGIKVRLEDQNQALVQQDETDIEGKFDFKKLRLDKEYRIVFEGDFPDDPEIVITNDFGQELKFKKVAEGVYEYVPTGELNMGSQMAGIVKDSEGNPLPGTQVILYDENGNQISTQETDEIGQFNFEKLDLEQSYKIKFQGIDPDESAIVLVNEFGRELNFFKVGNGEYEYIPVNQLFSATVMADGRAISNTYVRVEDHNRQFVDRFKTDEIGNFKFRKMDLTKDFWLVFESPVNEQAELKLTAGSSKITLIKESPVEFHYIAPKNFEMSSFTLNVEDREDLKETYPRPEETKNVIAYFQRYFVYNAKDINRNNKEFVSFINDIAKLVQLRGYADIMITSSASKVPTRTWKTNDILSKKRAYDTKDLLEQVFAEMGIKKEQYNFIDINTLITGPEYKGDYKSNREVYEKYQYVRIFIK